MAKLKNEMKLDFTTLLFYEDYVISTINEDVSLENEYFSKLEMVTNEFYKNKGFGYIVNRKNHYSIDPLIYFRASKIPRLIGIAAVVYHSRMKEVTAMFERKFFDKPFQVFDDLKPAEIWIQNLIQQKKQNSLA